MQKFNPESIKLLRKKHSLSMAQFGKTIGVERQSVWGWEAGKYHPRWTNFEKMAHIYGVPINYFFTKKNSYTSDNGVKR